MAVMRDRPYCNSNFLVDFGEGDSRSVTVGFAEVIFPQFTFRPRRSAPGRAEDSRSHRTSERDSWQPTCIETRIDRRPGLVEWWNNARHGKAAKRRTMKIELLGEDLSTVVLTWQFHDVYPVSLSYSPLRALEGGIVMESIELAFETMEMS